MKPLLLVKHSLPDMQADLPAREWVLSAEGRNRAERLAKLLEQYRPEAVISSVEPKAFQTAEVIAKGLSLSVHVFDGLHEHDRSNAPFYSPEEFQSLVREFFARPAELVFGAETAVQALGRFQAAVQTVRGHFPDQTITLVAHGTVIALFVEDLTRCNGYELWCQLGLPALVVLDVESRHLLETIPVI